MKFVAGKADGANQLVWGQDDKWNRFLFGISGNGQFIIGKSQDQKFIDIKPWATSSLIKINDFNKLTVRKIRDQFFFYLNEIMVFNCPYERFFGQGRAFRGNQESTIRIDFVRIAYIEKK